MSSDKKRVVAEQKPLSFPQHFSLFSSRGGPIEPAFKLCELTPTWDDMKNKPFFEMLKQEVTLHRNKEYLMYVRMPPC